MKTKALVIFLSFAFFTKANYAPFIGGPSYMQQAVNEENKINQLIVFIEKSDAKFVRNGTEYSAVDAAKHLRMKREKAGTKIKTAKEFIDNIASKSSMSGEPYQMKFKNGSVINVRDMLYHELKKIEAKQVGSLKGLKATKYPAC
ncbi:MAG: hypothetical protein CFE21_11195 [Bacteroidetes bacterium B1(2017)]|nr:MAG: hypothetical protein CFE21_11195 [Bacteroidetes bacterium B1(2017)]